MLKIADSVNRQKCLVKSEWHADMKFECGVPKENRFVNPPNKEIPLVCPTLQWCCKQESPITNDSSNTKFKLRASAIHCNVYKPSEFYI